MCEPVDVERHTAAVTQYTFFGNSEHIDACERSAGDAFAAMRCHAHAQLLG